MPARLLARALASLRALLVEQARGWVHGLRRWLGEAWAARPERSRTLAVLALLALFGSAAAALLAQARLPRRLPGPLAWSAAGALLARDARPGDAVVVAPAWLERAREVVPQAVPVVAADRLEGERLPGVMRAWLLSAPDAPRAGWDAEASLARRATRADTRRLGALEVTRFDLSAPVLPLASLEARPPPPATAALREAGGLPRRCLLFTPTPGAPVTLAFPATRLGRTLAGHAALLPGPGETPVRLAFLVDGAEVGALELRAGGGWLAWQVDTSHVSSGAHQVVVVATAAGEVVRPVCLEALALP